MTGFDVFLPWFGLAIVLYCLYRVQRFIQRHLFGVGYLIARDRGPATLLFYLVLLPGVLLHEISRYIIAGMFRVVPTHFTLFPEEQQDGTFELGFIHFGFIINPVYRAILDLVPLGVGIVATIIIGHFALGWTDFIGSLRTLDFYVISAAFQKLVSRPDFVLWSYILFGIANTMLPSRKEARGLWLPFAILIALLGVFAVFGIWMAVYRLMMGPVATIVYGLTTVFGLVLFIDVIAGSMLWLVERGLNAITHREVQYAPPESKLAKAAKVPPKSVFELQLPLPAPPGKPGFKMRSPITTLPVPAGESRPATRPADEPITVERPSRPAIGAPAAAATPPKPAALGSGGKHITTADEMTEPLPDEAPAKPVGLPVPKPTPLSGGMPAPKPAALGTQKDKDEDKEAEVSAKPATPLGTPRPASPFGVGAANKPASSPFPARPAATTSGSTEKDKDAEEPAKPASPLGTPRPAAPFGAGTANKPASSPFPARPAATTSGSTEKDKDAEEPAKPAAPLGTPRPASPFGAGANKPASSPFPARPAATTSGSTEKDKDAEEPAKPAAPLGTPRPASPFGAGTNKPASSPFPARPAGTAGGDKLASPFAPKSPTTGAASGGKATSNLPALRPNQQAAPSSPKSPIPVAGRPSPLSAPKSSPSDDDVIEGEVVDDNEPRYVPPEE
ncbi:MAG: hypothetical protein KF716_11115 [Anaerolineae bacterium]|nr:hypothetical protein [Anaerolineae bacterium]